jgi:hypothetical protein
LIESSVEMLAMHGLRAVDQVVERQRVERFDRLDAPRGGGHRDRVGANGRAIVN